MVSRLMPPSTSSAAVARAASSMRRARATLSSDDGMNCCPPKPGFTDITRRRSMSLSTSSTAESGVDGLSATPAAQPSSRMRESWRCRCGDTSAWIVSPVAPAATKSSK
jgi:hypothetical protein